MEQGILREFRFRLDWRFVTGLGGTHPIENGFSFDHTTGVPTLAGSSVKGVCRAAAVLDGLGEEEIAHLFGPKRVTAGERAP